MTRSTLSRIRSIAWVAVAVVAVAAAGMLFVDRGDDTGANAPASIGGPFALTDQTGRTVTEAALAGHPSALFFGYTFCPDVCPTTLADITVWLEELGADADALAVYFITVDPERDTREQMAAYLQAFDPRISGLTGSRAAIDAMLTAYGIYSRSIPGDNGDYTMDHSASVYLFDSHAKFVGTVDYLEAREAVLAKLRRLLAAS